MPCPTCKATLTVPNPQLLRAVEPVVAPLPEVQAPVPDQKGSKGEGASDGTGSTLIAIPFAAAVLTFLFRADQSIPAILTWLMVIGTAIVIYADAKGVIKPVNGKPPGKLDWLVKPSPVSWALSSLVLWIVCFPAYAKYRAKYGAKNLLLPALLGILAWFGSVLSVDNTPLASNRSNSQGGSESAHQRGERGSVKVDKKLLLRAEAATETLIRDSLKAPSTARFSAFRVIDSSGPYFQTMVSVDSENSFGAMLRDDFLVAFKLEDGGKFSYNLTTGVQVLSKDEFLPIEESERALKSIMEFQKRGLKWPGSEERKRAEEAKEVEE